MQSPEPIRPTSEAVLVTVWVTPNASRERIGGIHDGAIRIWVTAPPEDGKANDAVVALVASRIGSRRIRIVSGHTSRRKVVEIEGVTAARARRILLGDG